MDVVRHKTVQPDLDAEFATGFGEPVAIEGIIIIIKENPLAPIAALSDMMRNAGEYDADDRNEVAANDDIVKTGVSP